MSKNAKHMAQDDDEMFVDGGSDDFLGEEDELDTATPDEVVAKHKPAKKSQKAAPKQPSAKLADIQKVRSKTQQHRTARGGNETEALFRSCCEGKGTKHLNELAEKKQPKKQQRKKPAADVDQKKPRSTIAPAKKEVRKKKSKPVETDGEKTATKEKKPPTEYHLFNETVRAILNERNLPGWHDPSEKNAANVKFQAKHIYKITGMCWSCGNRSAPIAAQYVTQFIQLLVYISSSEGRSKIATLRNTPADASFPATHLDLLEYIHHILEIFSTLTSVPFGTPNMTPEQIVETYEKKHVEITSAIAAKAALEKIAITQAAEAKAAEAIKGMKVDASMFYVTVPVPAVAIADAASVVQQPTEKVPATAAADIVPPTTMDTAAANVV